MQTASRLWQKQNFRQILQKNWTRSAKHDMPVLPSVTSDPRPFPCTPVLDAVRRGAVHLLTISWSCQAPDRVCTRFVSISVPFACCSSSVVIVFTGSPVSITVMCSNNVTQQCKVNVPDVMPLTYNNVKLDLKVGKCRWSGTYTRHLQYEKVLTDAGCSKAEPKIYVPPQTLPGGAGRPKLNQLEMVTTFTYKPILVRIHARNFELSW